jgi:hypothetical protein
VVLVARERSCHSQYALGRAVSQRAPAIKDALRNERNSNRVFGFAKNEEATLLNSEAAVRRNVLATGWCPRVRGTLAIPPAITIHPEPTCVPLSSRYAAKAVIACSSMRYCTIRL